MKFAFALLLAAAPIGAAQGQELTNDAKLGEIVQLIQGGQPQQAVDKLNPLLADYERRYAGKPKPLCDVEPAETKAYAGVAGKDYTLADGGWCIALWAKGFALIDLKQLDAAVPFLERSVALAPFHPHYLSELGYAYQAQKSWQRSYDFYARAADSALRQEGDRRNKSLRRAWFGMAFDMIEMGRLDDAEKLFRKCLEVSPNDEAVKSELRYIEEQRAKKKTS